MKNWDNWEQLGLAIKIAVMVHDGGTDRAGKPYILHPLHLMNQLMFDPELAAIAVLHDVVEDSNGNITIEDIEKNGFSTRVLSALILLTHDEYVSYEDYISLIASNYDAIRVKRKDLEHNSQITRLKGVTKKDIARMEKYHKAFIFLGEAKLKFAR